MENFNLASGQLSVLTTLSSGEKHNLVLKLHIIVLYVVSLEVQSKLKIVYSVAIC